MKKGAWYAVAAYSTWGLFPVYWKALRHVPAGQILCHRIAWSCILLFAVVLLSRQGQVLRKAASSPRVLGIYTCSAALIGINWLTYIWSVNSGFVVEASLGYFLNPLVSVLLGVLLLGERLRGWQWGSIGLAAAGMAYLTWAHGSLPWIALTLAISFALYGLVKKLAPLGSLHGLTLETAILLPAAVVYLVACERGGTGAFLHSGALSDTLLLGAGPVTTVPLLLFAAAARRIQLSLLGVLQYISPVLQFAIGVLVYHEPFTRARLIGIGFVWLALILFATEGFLVSRARRIDRLLKSSLS